MRKAKLFVAGIIVAGALASVGCTRISPGYVGIKVVNGGSDRGVQDYPAQVGWVFYNPISSNVYEYPTFTQTAVWTKSLTEGNATNEEVTFTNKDQLLIGVDINLSYHLEQSRVPAFYVQFRSDNLNGFTHGFFRNLARDIFNEHAGQYDIPQIMGDNAKFLAEVRKALQDRVATYGIVIDQFGIIGAPRPPQAVIDAINAKVHATQLAIQKQNELVQVTADMAKEREKTDTYARNTLTMADAQATANRKLSESLSDRLIELKRLEKWNGVLPQVSGGSTPFINLSGAK